MNATGVGIVVLYVMDQFNNATAKGAKKREVAAAKKESFDNCFTGFSITSTLTLPSPFQGEEFGFAHFALCVLHGCISF
jgi:hypothetical protein